MREQRRLEKSLAQNTTPLKPRSRKGRVPDPPGNTAKTEDNNDNKNSLDHRTETGNGQAAEATPRAVDLVHSPELRTETPPSTVEGDILIDAEPDCNKASPSPHSLLSSYERRRENNIR